MKQKLIGYFKKMAAYTSPLINMADERTRVAGTPEREGVTQKKLLNYRSRIKHKHEIIF